MIKLPRPTRRITLSVGVAAALVGLGAASPAVAHDWWRADRTSSVSLHTYTEQVGAIGSAGGVTVQGDGYGSALAPVPGHADEVYGLTDRGPNVDGPNGTKIEPYPDFTPAIGRFRLSDRRGGQAVLLQRIPLRAADGTPYNGQVNPEADTGETITDLDGTVLPASKQGYDSEGLVALRDGTFWVSDEYGPYITHFDRRGRAIQRLSPYDGSLPRELARRTPNRGMEGLTVTPDGRTLVGVMQSALTQADQPKKATKVGVTRIVTVDLLTRKTHEYAYVLDDADDNGTAVSEINALSATRFVVLERDGDFGPGAEKKLWQIDTRGATDIGPATEAGPYDPSIGLTVDGATVEAIAGTRNREHTTADLLAAGITPVATSLYLDLGALVGSVDPDGTFFAHDKVEGLAIGRGGRRIIVSNDSDFGLASSTGDQPPFDLVAKEQPNGTPDNGQFLVIERS